MPRRPFSLIHCQIQLQASAIGTHLIWKRFLRISQIPRESNQENYSCLFVLCWWAKKWGRLFLKLHPCWVWRKQKKGFIMCLTKLEIGKDAKAKQVIILAGSH